MAARLPAVHLRIDTIEQALLRTGFSAPIGIEGYVVGYGIALDNLRLGHHVIADCVNPAKKSQDAWSDVAKRSGAKFLLANFVCGDADEHCRRVTMRQADIEGHVLPLWDQVSAMRVDSPAPGALSIDTCASSAESAVQLIIQRVA